MKILHINSNYDRTTLHQAMMKELDRLCENAVFVPTYDKDAGVIRVGSNVQVCQCFRKWDRFFFFRKQRKILRAGEDRFSVGDFDLLHAYTLFTDGNVAYRLHRKYGLPYVVAVRNTDVNVFFKYRPHLRGRGVKILRNAAAVCFLSTSYRDQVLEGYVPPRYRKEILDKSHIIPNGIDPYWFSRGQAHSKPPRGRLNLVFAGRMDRNKNITTTAKACELLSQKGYDARLTAIGKVADPELAKELSALDCVSLLPPMTKEELAENYVQQDIFVMPSHHESFGLVYAEAMSQGLPVVYSRGQGFDGQFPEGWVGYCANSRSKEEVADAIVRIWDRYEEISGRCVKECHRFHWETLVEQYRMIYEGCFA